METARKMTVHRRIVAIVRNFKTYAILNICYFLMGKKYRSGHEDFVARLRGEIFLHKCSMRVFWENHQYKTGDVVHCRTIPSRWEESYVPPEPVYVTVENVENGFVHCHNSRRTHHGLRLNELVETTCPTHSDQQ